jgi:hypothetical protein
MKHPAMKQALLLISLIAASTLPSPLHEALVQQPVPLTGSAAPAKAKTGQPPAPASSAKPGKKASAKTAQAKATPVPNPPTTPNPASNPAPYPPPIVTPPPPVVELLPLDLPPPAPNAPPAPSSPGAGSVASGITPVRYAAPTPGSTRLTASVPMLPPKPAPLMEPPAGAPAAPSMAPATMPTMPKVTPYTPPIFWPPVPGRKPAQGQVPTVNAGIANTTMAGTPMAGTPMAANSGMQSAAAKPGYTAVVPITPFGAAPPPQPAAAQPPPAASEPITFTVRLPTIVLWEPKP